MKPKVLLATTSRWYPTARLGVGLAKAGCSVEIVCPSHHPLGRTTVAHGRFAYQGLQPLRSLELAIEATQPSVIVPGDDLAARHLYRLYLRSRRRGKDSVCALIERSLGPSESLATLYARTAFMKVAEEQEVRVPKTEVVRNPADLQTWETLTGFPAVLKADGTSGGDGVRIVRSLEEAEHALHSLQAPPLMARALKRALVNQDATLVWPSISRQRPVVNAQAYVPGGEATSTVACWQGAVLGCLHFEVIKKRSARGPATVVRLIEHAEMSSAVEKMVRRLELSGLHGFDFMLEAATGNAYLIEMNPRVTQVGHLTLGPGRDLPAALYAAVSGTEIQAAPKITENNTIALFPQEWIRDPESEFVRSGYHDVPWEEPGLVQDCIDSRSRQSAWYSRAKRREARDSSPSPTPLPLTTPSKRPPVGLDCEAK